MNWSLSLTILCGILTIISFLYALVNHFCLPYIRTKNKLILTFSFSINLGFVLLLIADVYQTLGHSSTHSLVYLWRVIYWSNLSFGFLIFPIITEQEKRSENISVFRHLANYYRRRLLIVLVIAVPIIGLLLIVNKVSIWSLFQKDIIVGWPVFMLVLWGFVLLNVHLSLAFNVLPLYLFVRIFPSKEIGKC